MLIQVGCSPEDLNNVEPEAIDPGEILDTSLTLTDEILNTLKSSNYNISEVEVIDFHLPDGTIQKRYLLEGDITLSKAQMDQLIALESKSNRNLPYK